MAPYFEETLEFEKNSEFRDVHYEIPENLRKENLYVQVTAGGLSKTVSYFPTCLLVNVQENYGIVKILDQGTNRPMPKVYVKCFMRDTNGTVTFYKDGYTDMRGSFDYARLNTDKLDKVEKFSILVVGDEGKGLVVRECGPPSTLGKFSEGTLVGGSWKKKQEEMIAALNTNLETGDQAK